VPEYMPFFYINQSNDISSLLRVWGTQRTPGCLREVRTLGILENWSLGRGANVFHFGRDICRLVHIN